MNLIRDQWIKVVHRNHDTAYISPQQVAMGWNGENPIVDVAAARPDFRGALYQLLIGLLQTLQPPLTEKEWFRQWQTPPSENELKDRWSAGLALFELDSAGPAFMQDFDLPDGEAKSIAALLIEAPGGKTLKDNLDHFIRRGQVQAICQACAATALFTLQTNAPSGGVGHRTSLRGGGPLTTLVLPDEALHCRTDFQGTLWHKLWLNVLPENELRKKLSGGNWEASGPEAVFPWMGPTPTSDKKSGKTTLPGDVHPYQMYWGMPRRIRIDFSDTTSGTCDLCGGDQFPLVSRFVTKNYGINYTGPWRHPLTPYSQKDLSKDPLPLHGQKGGLTYRHWLGLTLGNAGNNQEPALSAVHFLDSRTERIRTDSHARIWAFGYDMDNMKARCWYDAVMPLYPVADACRGDFKSLVTDFVEAAGEMGANLRQEVKKAWYKRPMDVRGDWAFIDLEFWQSTEPVFYELIESGLRAIQNNEPQQEVRTAWHSALRRTAMDLFDRFALSGPAEALDLKRVSKARRDLLLWLNTGKKVKQLLGKK